MLKILNNCFRVRNMLISRRFSTQIPQTQDLDKDKRFKVLELEIDVKSLQFEEKF
jgi:hypothetical protein